MSVEAPAEPPASAMRRLEPAAITGVMSREVANFRSFWKSTTFSSVLEPVIYLLAFGLGLGSTIVDKVDGLDYVEFVGTGMVATARSSRRSRRCSAPSSRSAPAHLRRDPRSARRRRGARHRRGPVDQPAGQGSTAASSLIVAMLFASTRRRACCSCRCSGRHRAGLRVLRNRHGGEPVSKIDQFSYVTTLVITPLFLVAGTFFPIDQLPEGLVAAQFNPLHQLVELVRHAAFGFEATDVLRLAALVVFAVGLWRVAVRLMSKRLID